MSEVFLCEGLRTVIGGYGGRLAMLRPDELLAKLMQDILDNSPELSLDEIVIGCANQTGESGANIARMAALLYDDLVPVPAVTLNRLSGSGLEAIAYAFHKIRAGMACTVLAGGVENMSRAPFILPKADQALPKSASIHASAQFESCWPDQFIQRYGRETSLDHAEALARELSISRRDQDGYALRSQARAIAAIGSGRMRKEIAALKMSDAHRLSGRDELPALTNFNKLERSPALTQDIGTITQGNSAPPADGACAMVIADAGSVARYSLRPVARILGFAAKGTVPNASGVAVVPVIQDLLGAHKLSISDIDIIELDETNAVHNLAVMRALGLPDDGEHVNMNGGSIALGDPSGMTSARLALTAGISLTETGSERALIATGVAMGQGVAMLIAAV